MRKTRPLGSGQKSKRPGSTVTREGVGNCCCWLAHEMQASKKGRFLALLLRIFFGRTKESGCGRGHNGVQTMDTQVASLEIEHREHDVVALKQGKHVRVGIP